MDELIHILVKGGPFAISLAFALGIAVVFHKTQVDQLVSWGEEHKQDKAILMDVVKHNSQAISKNTSAVDSCTKAIEQNTQCFQRFIDGGKK